MSGVAPELASWLASWPGNEAHGSCVRSIIPPPSHIGARAILEWRARYASESEDEGETEEK